MADDPLDDTISRFGRAASYYELYEDRRVFPRIKLRAPGEVLIDGEAYPVTVHNISPDGLQIRCAREVALRIHPSGRHIEEGKGPEVHVRCELPLPEGASELRGRCQAWWFAVVPDGRVAFGLKFMSLEAKSREHLTRFIQQSLEPLM